MLDSGCLFHDGHGVCVNGLFSKDNYLNDVLTRGN